MKSFLKTVKFKILEYDISLEIDFCFVEMKKYLNILGEG